MTPELMIALGDELYMALARCQVVDPLTSRHPDITLEDAYGIQQQLNARRLAKGERIVGK